MAKLPGLFKKLAGKADDVSDIARYGDDIVDVSKFNTPEIPLYMRSTIEPPISPGDDFRTIMGLDLANVLNKDAGVDAYKNYLFENFNKTGRPIVNPDVDFTLLDANSVKSTVPDTASSHILGSNPNAIINRQPGYNYYHVPNSVVPGFEGSLDDLHYGFPIQTQTIDPYDTGIYEATEYTQMLPKRRVPNTRMSNSGATSLNEFMKRHYPQRYGIEDDLPF